MMATAAVVGRDGRGSALRRKLEQSRRIDRVVDLAWSGPASGAATVSAAREAGVEFVVVGPEKPLAEGIVDLLEGEGIRCVGPVRALARLESSKAFERELLTRHDIAGNPRHRIFRNELGIEAFMRELGEFVVKPD